MMNENKKLIYVDLEIEGVNTMCAHLSESIDETIEYIKKMYSNYKIKSIEESARKLI